MLTVEIRILAAVMGRVSHRSLEERFNTLNVDISGLQYGVLRTLAYESYTLSELSRKFVVDPSTLVPPIDALERKGLVTRERDPNDRRRVPLTLTPEGAKLIHNMPLMHEDDLLYQCLNNMGPEKAHELLELLREVVHRMPDGEQILQSITSRIYAYQKGENVTKPPECIIHRKENEQDRIIPRTTKRRVRRTRRT